MGSLTGTLSLAAQALEADQGALQVTSNNIANANTAGYSRQVAVFESAPTVTEGDLTFGQGVTLAQVQGIRDNVVELGVQQGLAQQGQVNSYLSSMNQVQSLFNEAQGAGIQTPLSNFFEAFQNLSTNPTDPSLREAVISAGQPSADALPLFDAGRLASARSKAH